MLSGAIIPVMSLFSMELPALLGQNAMVQVTSGFLASAGAASTSAAAVLTPPGMEGASLRAVSQQVAAVEQWSAMFAMGMEQIISRSADTETFSVATTAIDEAGSSVMGAIASI